MYNPGRSISKPRHITFQLFQDPPQDPAYSLLSPHYHIFRQLCFRHYYSNGFSISTEFLNSLPRVFFQPLFPHLSYHLGSFLCVLALLPNHASEPRFLLWEDHVSDGSGCSLWGPPEILVDAGIRSLDIE